MYIKPLPYKDLGVPDLVKTVGQRLSWALRQLELYSVEYNKALPAKPGRAKIARRKALCIMLGEAQRDASYGFYGDYKPSWTAATSDMLDGVVSIPLEVDKEAEGGEELSYILALRHKLHKEGRSDVDLSPDFKAKYRAAALACAKGTGWDLWL